MLKIVLLIICLLTISSYAYIDPALDAERRAFLPSFLMKITETRSLALSNLTAHATEHYCWNNQYSGSFCDDAAKDYVIILFEPVPFYNSTTGETQYMPLNLIGITVLGVDLVTDGVLNDTYSIKYILNNTQLNGQTFTYDYQDGLYYTTYYVFPKGSNRVSSETVTSDDGAKFVGATSYVADIQQLCLLVVNYACAPGTEFEQYSSYEKCIETMQIINKQNEDRRGGCPDIQVSNSTACRILHAATALTDPTASQALHCPHAGNPSTHCIDYCWDVCDHCDINADCQYLVNQYGTRTYQCVCKDGYIGNGTSCAPTNCTERYQCAGASNYNFVGCNTQTNKCNCQPSFIWNQTTGGCDCPTGYGVWYINGAATCLQNGRCEDKYECTTSGQSSAGVPNTPIGTWNQVQCVAYGPLTTLFPHKTCVCNYGYTGGFFIPCTCETGRSEVWSPVVNGNVCIAPSQCVADYTCPSGKTCNFAAGPSSGVGVCL